MYKKKLGLQRCAIEANPIHRTPEWRRNSGGHQLHRFGGRTSESQTEAGQWAGDCRARPFAEHIYHEQQANAAKQANNQGAAKRCIHNKQKKQQKNRDLSDGTKAVPSTETINLTGDNQMEEEQLWKMMGQCRKPRNPASRQDD
ncbi:hypothetical protein B0H14DRAFT_2615202 [Mycena olivaceomarginata]|nr:hypothetical protein B0H14DRAFT_2615202 [Mycena olivaceomarginata]